jgi:hypothetical protein
LKPIGKSQAGAFLAIALLTLTAGCGGVNASKSVSPLDFILPGLLKVQPRPPSDHMPSLETNRVDVLVAQAN